MHGRSTVHDLMNVACHGWPLIILGAPIINNVKHHHFRIFHHFTGLGILRQPIAVFPRILQFYKGLSFAEGRQ